MDETTRLEDILVQHGMKEDAARRVSEEASGLDIISIIDELDSIENDDIKSAHNIIEDHDIYVSLDDFNEIKPKPPKQIKIGESKMKNRKNITEGVLGMSNVGALGRLRKLAGIPIKEDDTMPEVTDDEGMTDQDSMNDSADSFSDDNYAVDDQNNTNDFSNINDTSDAMSTVQDAINNISTSLPDLKISEYKQVVDQIKNLLDSARDSGRSYIGENRIRKMRNRLR